MASIFIDNVAQVLGSISYWAFATLWLIVGISAISKRYQLVGYAFILAFISHSLFSYLFYFDSGFTSGWETDAPLSVSYAYKPLGFIAANLLPLITNVSLAIAILSLYKNLIAKHKA